MLVKVFFISRTINDKHVLFEFLYHTLNLDLICASMIEINNALTSKTLDNVTNSTKYKYI